LPPSSSADSNDADLQAQHSPTAPGNSPANRYSMSNINDLNQLGSATLSTLDTSQIQAIHTLIDQAVMHDRNQRSIDPRLSQNQLTNDQVFASKKQRSKLIDIRFIVDLIFSRFYVVLLVGKDIRKERRSYPVKGITKIGNLIAAFILIISINLLISAFVALGLYLLKSSLDINLFPGHFSEQIESLI